MIYALIGTGVAGAITALVMYVLYLRAKSKVTRLEALLADETAESVRARSELADVVSRGRAREEFWKKEMREIEADTGKPLSERFRNAWLRAKDPG